MEGENVDTILGRFLDKLSVKSKPIYFVGIAVLLIFLNAVFTNEKFVSFFPDLPDWFEKFSKWLTFAVALVVKPRVKQFIEKRKSQGEVNAE